MLNPENEAGRLTLICRFGADKVVDKLPALIRAVEREGKSGGVVVRPDARQHHHAATGYKTRPFDLILREVQTRSSTCIAPRARIRAASTSR